VVLDGTFGTWIKRRRKALDLTQKDLADRVGCSTATIHKIEREERRPSRQIAGLLAKVLEIPPEQQLDFIKVARGERSTDRIPDSTLPAVQTSASRQVVSVSRLPVSLTPIIGRGAELAEIHRLLYQDDCHLLTIIGEGGIGKTRLAIEVARRLETFDEACVEKIFPDGVYYVPLESVSTPEQLVLSIAKAIGFKFYGQVDHRAQFIDYLRDKCMLLLLDNFEHLLQETTQLTDMLTAAAGVKVLVTSIERLKLQGEWVFTLQGLPYPPMPGVPTPPAIWQNDRANLESFSAVALFVQCARRRSVDFQISEDNQIPILQICQLVDGLPLGIELAASWISALSPEEIVREIEKDTAFLETSTRDIPERHRSIRAVFDHSWKLLSEKEKRALRQLTVFRNEFTRQAAELVAGASLSILISLMDKSLLHRTHSGRYKMHDLVRQYAVDRLSENPQEYRQTRTLHSSYFLSLLASREQDMHGPRKQATLEELSDFIIDIRLAWEWAYKEHHLQDLKLASAAFLQYHEFRNLFPQGHAVFNDTLQELQASKPVAQTDCTAYEIALGDVLSRSAYFTLRIGRIQEGIAKLQAGTELLEKQNNPALLADLSWYKIYACAVAGSFAEAIEAARAARELNRRLGNKWQESMSLMICGHALSELGELDEARQVLTEGLSLARGIGDSRLIILGIGTLSRVDIESGDPKSALTLLEEGQQIAAETGDYFAITLALHRMAIATQAIQDYSNARHLFLKSIEFYRKISDYWGLSRCLTRYGQFLLEIGAVEESGEPLLEALGIANAAGATPVMVESLINLAMLKNRLGDAGYAIQILDLLIEYPNTSQPILERASAQKAEVLADLPDDAQSRPTAPAILEDVIADLLKGH